MSSSKTTIDQQLRDAVNQLTAAGVDSPRTDALVLLEKVLQKERIWVLSHLDEEMTAESLSALSPLLKRRINREPLAYIIATRDFYGIPLQLSSNVLIPRPETESIVEYMITHLPDQASLLDLGTGSGAIALAVKKNRDDVTITATDVSKDVLAVAGQNSLSLGLNINFVHSDMFTSVSGRFDAIAANLPYVPLAEKVAPELSFEPQLALYSGDDGLDHYRIFFDQLSLHLARNGFCVIEHHPPQKSALTGLAANAGFTATALSPFTMLIESNR